MAELTEDQVKDILQGISIPSQPQIMVDLQLEEIMPDPDIARIAELISQDVGLSGTILKVVNSPSFAAEEPILSVEEGVKRLGINTIINITNGLSIKGEMSDELIRSMNRFWDSANDIATVASTLAQKLEYPKPEEAYVLGLFHNCGVPLLLKRFSNYMDVLATSYSGKYARIIDHENEQLKTDHAVLGYITAKAWKLPLHLCKIIEIHHSAKSMFTEHKDTTNDDKTLMAILKMSEHIAGTYWILGQQDDDPEWIDFGPDVLEYLGLSEFDFDNLKEEFSGQGIGPTNYGM